MTSASETFQAGPGKLSEDRSALIAGIGCYVLWGGLSLQFMALGRHGVGPWEILAWRCAWALPWAAGPMLIARQTGAVRVALGNPRTLALLALTAALVSVNWATFIWASTTGRKLDASFGYYVNPLLNVAAGAVLFRERFTRTGAVAVGLAVVGVLLQGVALGHPPWLSLGMASTFWAYGVIRKRMAVPAQAGLFVECLVLAPLGLAYAAWLAVHGVTHFGAGVPVTLLILALGPATAIPLAMFAYAAHRLPLSTVGFMQFVLPTLIFLIAMATGEPMTPLRALSFGFIWAGVAVFSAGAWRGRQTRPLPFTGEGDREAVERAL